MRPFIPILMVSERLEPGEEGGRPNRTAEETAETARALLAEARRRVPGFANGRAILDPGIAPIGSDCEGQLKRVLESLALIHSDPSFAGVHMSVGLSNFTPAAGSTLPCWASRRSSLSCWGKGPERE